MSPTHFRVNPHSIVVPASSKEFLDIQEHDIILLSMKFPWFCFWKEGATLEELKGEKMTV